MLGRADFIHGRGHGAALHRRHVWRGVQVHFGDDQLGNGTNPNPGIEASYDVDTIVAMAPDPNAPSDRSDPAHYFTGTDLAILHLDQMVTGYTPYKVFAHEVGQPIFEETVTFAGFGASGTGTTGPTAAPDGVKRAAFNTFDFVTGHGLPNGDVSAMYYADFDGGGINVTGGPVPVLAEGLTGPGDSGGPMMFWRDEWVVSGVLWGVFDTSGNGVFGDFGDLGIWNSFFSQEARAMLASAGATFYVAAVPLPASALFLLGALLGLMALRRRAQ
jgi:hypothetical protein